MPTPPQRTPIPRWATYDRTTGRVLAGSNDRCGRNLGDLDDGHSGGAVLLERSAYLDSALIGDNCRSGGRAEGSRRRREIETVVQYDLWKKNGCPNL